MKEKGEEAFLRLRAENSQAKSFLLFLEREIEGVKSGL